jgi:hypothetical protein
MGGMVSGLAAIVTFPDDPVLWGMGGMVSGLAAIVTFPDDPVLWGMGGIVSGLATATVVATAITATRTAARTVINLLVMVLHLLRLRKLRIQRVTRKWEIRHHKSNIAREIFFEPCFLLILHGFRSHFRLLFARKIGYLPFVRPMPRDVAGCPPRKQRVTGAARNCPSTTYVSFCQLERRCARKKFMSISTPHLERLEGVFT